MKRLTRRIVSNEADCAYCTDELYANGKCKPGCSLRKEQLEKLAQYEDAEESGRLIVLPCKVNNAIDKLFSHNEIIALWYNKPNDKQFSHLLWRGEAYTLPKEYSDATIIRIFGSVSEKISESDTINILVHPLIIPAYEAEKAKERENDA